MNSPPKVSIPVLQLRVVIEAEDFDAAIAFYRDALGLQELVAFEGDGDARVSILDAGRATLEIANPAQKQMIDLIETGAPQLPGIRLAFEVTDGRGVTKNLQTAGALVVGVPRETPWLSLNSRLDSPTGLQITIFEELKGSHERAQQPGFGTAGNR